jgi:hypothetical protein
MLALQAYDSGAPAAPTPPTQPIEDVPAQLPQLEPQANDNGADETTPPTEPMNELAAQANGNGAAAVATPPTQPMADDEELRASAETQGHLLDVKEL